MSKTVEDANFLSNYNDASVAASLAEEEAQ